MPGIGCRVSTTRGATYVVHTDSLGAALDFLHIVTNGMQRRDRYLEIGPDDLGVSTRVLISEINEVSIFRGLY